MPDLPEELAALLRERAGHAPVPAAPPESVVPAVRRRQYGRAAAAASGTALALATIVGVAAAVPGGGPGSVTPLHDDPSPSGTPQGASCGADGPHGGMWMTRGQDSVVLTAPVPGARLTPYAGDETATAQPDPTREPDGERTEDATRSASPVPGETSSSTAEPGTSAYLGIGIVDDAGAPRFDQPAYQARAGVSCTAVTNESRTGHEIVVRDATGADVWRGLDTHPPGVTVVHLVDPGLDQGRYTLLCRIHPAMRATVDVS